MKKVVSLICAAALAVLCAVPAFAEATAGEAANNAAVTIINTADKTSCVAQAQTIAAESAANPEQTVTKEQASAAASVIDALADQNPEAANVVTVKAGENVSNTVSFQSADANKIANVSLTKQSDTTLVLSADWSEGQPSMGVEMAVYGLDTGASYQLVYVDGETRTTYDTQLRAQNGAVVFWVPHFSTYEIVRTSAANNNSSNSSSTTTVTASGSNDAANADAEFYTCPACGYHNWTGVNGGYKCDNCGHIECKDLSNCPNVKGTATLPTAKAATTSAANPIKATSANLDLVVLFVLAAAAAVVGGGALVVKKQGLGK